MASVIEKLDDNMMRRPAGDPNGIIYVRGRVNGKDKWVSTKTRDLKSARIKAAEIAKTRHDEKLGWKTEKKAPIPTVDAYTKLYLRTYSVQKKKNSAEGDRVALIRWQTLYGERKLDSLVRTDFVAYMNWRLGGPRPDEKERREEDGPAGSVNTLLHELAVMHTVLNAAIADNILSKNPMSGLKRPEGEARTRVLTLDEQARVFELLPPEYQRLMTVFLGTGLRANELLKLEDTVDPVTQRKEIDFDAGFINLPAKKAKGGKKARQIPMYPEVEEALREQLKARETGKTTIIQRPGGLKRKNKTAIFNMGRESALQRMHDTSELAGIEEFTIHDFRRTFGTRCAEAGMPLKHLADVMGHSDIAITAKYYLHIGKDNLKQTMLKLDLGLKARKATKKVVNFEKKR